MESTTTQKEVCKFIGLVNHYCDIRERKFHTLQPLTSLISRKAKFKLENNKQKAFEEVK